MSLQRARVAIVRAAAVVQGLALVVVATVSTVLTNPSGLGLSSAAYGTLFVPQSIFAVICSFGGTVVTRRYGARATLVAGFAANAVAMTLLTGSALLSSDHLAAYVVLLCATSALGIGFALVTPTLNVLAAALDAKAPDRAGLIVNALLGASAAAAPLLLLVFVGFGFWWGLPLICAIGMVALLAATARTSFAGAPVGAPQTRARLPVRVALFAGFALFYGLCEQLNGSWAALYMTQQLGASPAYGSIALTLFWAVATGGRVVFAVFSRVFAPAIVFRVLPFVLALAFAGLARLPSHGNPVLGSALFALAGLGVSALLPLVLSFCERSVPEAAASATGIVFAVYLVGYGLAAFGVGPLLHSGITFPVVEGAAAAVACVVAAGAFAVVTATGRR